MSRFFSKTGKHGLQLATAILWVFEIKLLYANDAPSKTICSISVTSCWQLKSKSSSCALLKIHKKLDESTGYGFFFTAMLRLIAHNIGDRVSFYKDFVPEKR